MSVRAFLIQIEPKKLSMSTEQSDHLLVINEEDENHNRQVSTKTRNDFSSAQIPDQSAITKPVPKADKP